MSYKIGVVGHKESVMAFKLVGFDVTYAETTVEARKAIDKMAQQNYGVIYVSDVLLLEIPEVVSHYEKKVTPASISIPTHLGSNGYGKSKIKEYVEKAVGQDIL